MSINYKILQLNKSRFLNINFVDINEVPNVLRQSYLPSLDGLRALSILMVIGSHVLLRFHIENNFLSSIFNGSLGVNIFFVISGFIITTLLMKEQIETKNINLKNFYIRRFLRIFPLAYLFLFILIILNQVFKMGISFSGFLISFLYLRNFGKIEENAATAHYWSLSVEEQYYLIFPYFFKKSRKLYLLLSITLIFFIIPTIIYLYYHILWFNRNYGFEIIFILVKNLTSILIGSVFSIIFFKYSYKFKKYSSSILSVLILLVIFIINSNFPLLSRIRGFVYTGTVSGILIALFIGINVFERKSLIFKALNNRKAINLGKLSYSIYVWQQIFTLDIPWIKTFKLSNSIILNLIALFIVSYLSYNYFEKPFLKFKRKFQTKN